MNNMNQSQSRQSRQSQSKEDILESLEKNLEFFEDFYHKVEKQKEQASNAYSFLFDSSPYYFEKLKKDAAFNDAFNHVDDAAVAISGLTDSIEDLIEFYDKETLPTNVDNLDDLLKEHEMCIEDVKESLDNLDTCLCYLKKYCNDLFDDEFKIDVNFEIKYK